MLEISHDPENAKMLASRIDVTSFKMVKNYYRSPSSEIRFIIIVQEPYDLAVIGSAALESIDVSGEKGNGARKSLLDLVVDTDEIIRLGVDNTQRIIESYRHLAAPLDSYADDDACEVLYLPPMYLVKFTGKKYR